jgi:hypothetical protein
MPRDLGLDLRLRAFLGFLGLFRRRISRLLIRWKQDGSREGMDYAPVISFHADIVRLLPPQSERAKFSPLFLSGVQSSLQLPDVAFAAAVQVVYLYRNS